ncbi:hypothetical protein [Pseudescherichia vulneris]|uniref:Uncharacterized protein n=1 Tax=Pseudescherichia vulneris NBRC 102420 TaxID=1115515 RepID=A0A090V6R3_PSEVU|nr:hypothetical protein [Pseudescherichia vulneris]GAL58944.1 hypothetical protein EV102420_14_00020 [Pseudescherichia vulneris NBRC 102420]
MNLNEIAEKLCNILFSSAYNNEANEIRSLMIKVLSLEKNDPVRISAIDDLISRCHPKWLGDYYIKNITYSEWTDLIIDFKNELKRVR